MIVTRIIAACLPRIGADKTNDYSSDYHMPCKILILPSVTRAFPALPTNNLLNFLLLILLYQK
ncbi:MAG: hypothetical protein LBG46_05990 [Elusimicrobiota bacterium]|nr:hypothetical protein [Elusimicrobiota bacterium]